MSFYMLYQKQVQKLIRIPAKKIVVYSLN